MIFYECVYDNLKKGNEYIVKNKTVVIANGMMVEVLEGLDYLLVIITQLL